MEIPAKYNPATVEDKWYSYSTQNQMKERHIQL